MDYTPNRHDPRPFLPSHFSVLTRHPALERPSKGRCPRAHVSSNSPTLFFSDFFAAGNSSSN